MQNETPEQRRRRPHRLVAVLAVAALAAVVLAACGSSSSTTTAGSATNSASTTQSGSRASRFASLQACLKKEGIDLPARPSGSGSQPPNGGPLGAHRGGFKLPEGVSREKFQEALKKCGGGNFQGRRGGAFDSAAGRAAFTKFAACMRENGVNVPAPNTSGKGPVFDTKGIDTSSAAFKKAQQKCRPDLKGAFGGGAGGAPPGGALPQGGPPGEGAPGA